MSIYAILLFDGKVGLFARGFTSIRYTSFDSAIKYMYDRIKFWNKKSIHFLFDIKIFYVP